MLSRTISSDYGVMRKILQVKLTLDSRRVPTVFSQSARRPSAKPKLAKDENRKALPFSEPFAAARQREGMLLIPLMFVAFGFAGLHYAGTSLCC